LTGPPLEWVSPLVDATEAQQVAFHASALEQLGGLEQAGEGGFVFKDNALQTADGSDSQYVLVLQAPEVGALAAVPLPALPLRFVPSVHGGADGDEEVAEELEAMAEQLLAYLPEPARSVGAMSHAELRSVTVLFFAVPSVSASSVDCVASVQIATSVVVEELQSRGGCLRQSIVDDKVCCGNFVFSRVWARLCLHLLTPVPKQTGIRHDWRFRAQRHGIGARA
jgi:hypothetical protein